MKTQTIVKTACVVLLAVFLVWWYYPEQNAEQIKYHTQALSVGKIESTVNSSGSISPVVTVDVGSELSGLISQLNVDFNDVVTSGQVIARIDDRTVQSKLRQSEADLASARASLVQLQAGLSKAQTEEKLAEREYQRTRELRAKNLVSTSELDISETSYQLAKVSIETANAAILVGEARVQQSLSSLEQAKLDLDRTYIRSPVDGVIIDRQVDKGQAVSASLSAPTLFSIAQDLVNMQIEADVDEADIGRIKQHQGVKFTVDAYPERKFTGVVSQVRKAATVTSNVVTYKVIISVENKDLLLLPGMTANVDIILGERDNVLRVSNSALRFTPEGQSTNGERSGPDMSARVKDLAEQLSLSAEQSKLLADAMATMQKSMLAARESRSNMGGGPPAGPNDAMKKIRAQMDIELRSFLSAEQMEQYQALNQQRRKPRSEGNNNELQRAVVWVLRDGEPQRVNVRVGIADLEYSELVSDELQEGDLVIVRAQKVSS
ncbi:MAG: efflux RND transporter periplasmic adaptor subunit [Paraglaciecola sp.]|uniref:efflux RND transporter periplasmic adaptor subunit n=1 Tax=Paraglaciecola sp. TaxID=1920173 RepID=UPI00273F557C|nr:efflux RND transporter periplasmic adaptor subunit [Paraglaciecola sp.]MDP5031014.1 efflux RND transporter periplasmic adaptor subunit [Paraglaciecola sp.]MDP5040442.1 efflux RND transporter periplasmic adaptor subunit [Paraglaciecola sp.]MDP5132038.1 efflux RND transporter periplasmic adaptor subunit [Paraglaciecola sp.]